eukprot:COSAG04_NODE_308_length_17238_cov_10.434039_7_plen_340_part_00
MPGDAEYDAKEEAGLPPSQVAPTLRKLYLVSVLHGFSDACAKLSTPGFVLELFGDDFLGASAFFALVNSGQSIAEFLLNPLLGSLSDRFGRKFFLMAWPPINTISRLLVMKWTNPRVILAQQVLVKMLEYTFEKAIAASSADMVTGDRRSVVAGNVSMLKIGLGFLLGAGFISRFSANDPRPGYIACSAATGLASLLMLVMPETLSPTNVKPVDWSKCQPLSFLELLRPSSPYNQVSNGASLPQTRLDFTPLLAQAESCAWWVVQGQRGGSRWSPRCRRAPTRAWSSRSTSSLASSSTGPQLRCQPTRWLRRSAASSPAAWWAARSKSSASAGPSCSGT